MEAWDFGISKELAMVEDVISKSIHSEEKLLTNICSYVIGAGGKRIRPTVAILSFKATGGTDVGPIVEIAAALEMIHSATLIHDDINDGGIMRRGRLAAYKKFGLQNALVTGDFLFTKAFGIGGKFSNEIVDLTAEACVSLAEGEIRQKRRAKDLSMTQDEYIDIIRRKTAWPISAGARIGALLAGASPQHILNMGEYGMNLGIAFQIVDDILDVVGDPKVLGKPAGTDVKEGNMTLVTIHAVNNGSSTAKEELVEILKKKRKGEGEIRKALELIEASGAINEARIDAQRYADLAKRSLGLIPNSPYKIELMRLVDFVLNRNL